ncbi:MAG: signal peptidase I [Lachnospiraceae bacterium]
MKRIRHVWRIPVVRMACKMLAIVFALASVLLNIFTYVTPIVRHYGNSMEPKISDHQMLLVLKTNKVSDGDIVAFYYNNKVLVRRVVASAGDEISMDVLGEVSVNGKKLEEPYVEKKSLGQCNTTFPFRVPVNSIFVLGDNRITSMDSRLQEIGAITKDRVIGKVILL